MYLHVHSMLHAQSAVGHPSCARAGLLATSGRGIWHLRRAGALQKCLHAWPGRWRSIVWVWIDSIASFGRTGRALHTDVVRSLFARTSAAAHWCAGMSRESHSAMTFNS